MTDFLGSTEQLLDPSGASVVSYTYGPYGETTATCAGSPCIGEARRDYLLGFTGYRLDEFTVISRPLYYGRNREYDPEMGRFVQQDPLGTVAGPNVYEYAAGSPTSFVDPLGLYIMGNYEGYGWSRIERARSGIRTTGQDVEFNRASMSGRDPLLSSGDLKDGTSTKEANKRWMESSKDTPALASEVDASGDGVTETGPAGPDDAALLRECPKGCDLVLQDKSSEKISERNLNKMAERANEKFEKEEGALSRTRALMQGETPREGSRVVYVRFYDSLETSPGAMEQKTGLGSDSFGGWVVDPAAGVSEIQIWLGSADKELRANMNMLESRDYFANAIAHETGHFLGLRYEGSNPKHNPSRSSVMRWDAGTWKPLYFEPADFHQVP